MLKRRKLVTKMNLLRDCLFLISFVSGYLLSSTCVHAARTLSTVKRLHEALLADYDRTVRPIGDQDDALRVEFAVSLVQVADLDGDSGTLTIITWLHMFWKDDQLTWNTKDYEGTADVTLPLVSIWSPDIRLINALGENVDESVDVVVTSSGHVTAMVPARYDVTCMYEFRGNVWLCPLKFASWSYPGSELDIRPKDDVTHILIDSYIDSDYYVVVEHDGERRVDRDGKTRIPAMDYHLKLRSKLGPSLLGR